MDRCSTHFRYDENLAAALRCRRVVFRRSAGAKFSLISNRGCFGGMQTFQAADLPSGTHRA
ncbi:MAG: hypothetical protein ACLTR6_05835 [Clostridium fessum]